MIDKLQSVYIGIYIEKTARDSMKFLILGPSATDVSTGSLVGMSMKLVMDGDEKYGVKPHINNLSPQEPIRSNVATMLPLFTY